MFKCSICPYESNRKFNLQQHNRRKKICQPVIPHVESTFEQKSTLLIAKDKTSVKNECNKCSKQFSCKSSLTHHSKTCKGIKKIHCESCLKVFASKQSKWWHKNHVKCEPRVAVVPETLKEENERLQNTIKALTTTSGKQLVEIKLKDKEIENYKKEIETFMNQPNQPKAKIKPKRGFVTSAIRTQVAASQMWCCRICTEMLTGIFHIDHTVPLSFGGEDKLENVTALCVQCHAVKTQNEWKQRSDN